MLLTQLPDELPAGFDRSRTYDARGWTTFERCSAELGAKPACLGFAKWKLVIDVASDDGGAQRRLPATPERMATLLAACRFTNGADSAAVLVLYEKTAKAVLGTVEKLYYVGLPLVRGDAWTSPALLAEALNHCESLRYLVLAGNRLDDEGEFLLRLRTATRYALSVRTCKLGETGWRSGNGGGFLPAGYACSSPHIHGLADDDDKAFGCARHRGAVPYPPPTSARGFSRNQGSKRAESVSFLCRTAREQASCESPARPAAFACFGESRQFHQNASEPKPLWPSSSSLCFRV